MIYLVCRDGIEPSTAGPQPVCSPFAFRHMLRLFKYRRRPSSGLFTFPMRSAPNAFAIFSTSTDRVFGGVRFTLRVVGSLIFMVEQGRNRTSQSSTTGLQPAVRSNATFMLHGGPSRDRTELSGSSDQRYDHTSSRPIFQFRFFVSFFSSCFSVSASASDIFCSAMSNIC
jgi:hypothetical protein